ncbi:methyltransferase-like protein 24 [Pollicipes pollicipes]|nr:methyltransferase-like protein 24 [Pollicipes pollicipes]
MQPGGKCFCSGNDGGQCEVVAAMDGKKPVCLDAGLLPEGEPCLVYSFGVRTDPSFEVEMARFGCEVHAFDPTVAKMTSLPAGVQHHLIGIDGRTWTHRTADGRDLPLMTLDDLKSALGHEGRRIDYIKLDAEGSEWNVLQHQLTAGGTALRGTPQVAIEFHLMFPHGTLSDNPSWQHQLLEEDARHQLRTLRALETAGFRLATIKSFGEFPGIGLAHAYETLWIQREGGDEGT